MNRRRLTKNPKACNSVRHFERYFGWPAGAYLTLPSLKTLIFVEREKPSVTLHRRKPGGGFAIEHHLGLDAVIPLPEIDASLALADLYDRAELG